MEKHVPSEVIMEIFLRLPARSVGRFRSLAKLYHRLLSQPLFIKDHLLHGGVTSSVKLLVHMFELNHKTKWCIYYPFSSFDKDLTLHGSDLKYPSYENLTNLWLLGTCNGLFCVEDSTKNLVMLWNPTTREICCLPRLPYTILENNNSGQVTRYDYGFGYDSLNEDFKVACVVSVSDHKVGFLQISSTTKTYIYSHRSRCWKEIQPFPQYTIDGKSEFVHNKIHWVPYCYQDGKYSQLIVSLDLATERYGMVGQPNYHQRAPGIFSRKYGSDQVNPCVLRGELCVHVNYRYENDFQVWMMKEYGDEQSWCHVLSISIENLVFSFQEGKAICEPLFMMKSGEILLQAVEMSSSSIYLYNPKTCSFITVHTGTLLAFCVSGHVYVESLVELK